VVAVNTALDSAPETLNKDPYAAGWILKLKASNPAEAASLLDAAAYAQLTA
jgi:glycine cleavage system H protein